MSAASVVLQKAVFDKLAADSVLAAMITGVHDWAPDDQPLPFVQMGEDIVTDWSTKSFIGTEHRMTLHVWSYATGRLATKQIMAEVLRILQPVPVLAAYNIIVWQMLTAQVLRDADARLHHGVIEYRARLAPL